MTNVMADVSVLVIGDEILDGRVEDTNSRWLHENLLRRGFRVSMIITVGDDLRRLRTALSCAWSLSDVTMAVGGLGPTGDDLTREAASEALRVPLRRQESLEERVRGIFRKLGRDMPPSNLRQADVLEGAVPLLRGAGTAPGQILEKEGKVLVLLPGVPREMMVMAEEEVFPFLEKKYGRGPAGGIAEFTVAARSESEVAEAVSSAVRGLPGLKVSYRALPGRVEVRMEAGAGDEDVLERAEERVDEVLGGCIVARKDETLEENLGKLLVREGLSLAVAESCTGGMVGERITRVPGSSRYFRGGVVAYTYRVKEEILGVDRRLLEEKGAVCPEVAEIMARKAGELFHADIGLAVTGVAGPSTGGEREPVGTVALGIFAGGKAMSWKVRLPGDRDAVRETASTVLLSAAFFHLRSGEGG